MLEDKAARSQKYCGYIEDQNFQLHAGFYFIKTHGGYVEMKPEGEINVTLPTKNSQHTRVGRGCKHGGTVNRNENRRVPKPSEKVY